jgi:hypothetical protein
MLGVLVETKHEYTTHLTNILAPLVFEGIQSVYKQSLEVSKDNDVLKIFQSFLKAIPKWNQVMIETETNRIINSSHSYGWLNDLIKATLKANLIVLMYNPTCKTQSKVEPKLYQNIKTTEFIHRLYIECARELYNNPYLLYHNYPPIEIKRNQRDCMSIIKDCIKESLRKLLPVKHILKIYLGEDIEIDNNENQFEKVLTDVEERNLTKIIQKDLACDNPKPNIDQFKTIDYKPDIEQFKTIDYKQDNPIKSNTEEKTIGSKILNIINDSVTSSDIASILESDKMRNKTKVISENSSSDSVSSDSLKKTIEQYNAVLSTLGPKGLKLASSQSELGTTKKIDVPESKLESFEDKIKKVLQKDLATDSDLETSLNYSQEDNDNKYQEIFSNSVNSSKKDQTNTKYKKKFFNNYLHF